ncbi:MAG: DUF4365 domain-containing protein [Polyangiaceae bacterium]
MSWQQQEFSFAYIQAVASVAGFATERHSVDYDGVDLGIHAHGGGGLVVSPRLDVQVKSKAAGKPAGFPWSYALEVENYDKLVPTGVLVPRILIVVAIPADVADWLKATPQQLALRHCAYWLSLRGAAATTNTSTVTVHLPSKQRLSPKELQAIMTSISQGGLQ